MVPILHSLAKNQSIATIDVSGKLLAFGLVRAIFMHSSLMTGINYIAGNFFADSGASALASVLYSNTVSLHVVLLSTARVIV